MAAGADDGIPRWGIMETLGRWFREWSQTESGSIVLFLAVFLARVAIDRWQRLREKKPKKKRKEVAHG